MRLVDHYSKFIYPFNLSPMSSRVQVLRRLLASGRWEPRLFGNSPGERHLPSKSPDELRTEYVLPSVRRYLFPTVEHTRAQLRHLVELRSQRRVEALAYHLDRLSCLYFTFNMSSAVGSGGARDGLGIGCSLRGGEFAKAELFEIELQLFEHGIGLLSLTLRLVGAPEKLTLPALMDFNYEFRALEPFYHGHLTFDLEILGRQWKSFHLVNYLLAEFDVTQMLWEVKKPMGEAQQVDRIYGINEIYDDRALVYSFACVARDQDFEDPEFERYRSGFLWLRRSTQTDELDAGYRAAAVARSRFARWRNAEYSFGREGGCFIGSEALTINVRDQPRYFGDYYFDLFRLTLYQRLLLLRVSEELADVRALLRSASTVDALRRRFLEFNNRAWHSQVTSRQQGQDVYRRWGAALETAQLYAEVDAKVREIDSALSARASAKRDRLLMVVTMLFLPVSLVAGILGMNIGELGAGSVYFKNLAVPAILVAIGFPILVLAIGFWESVESFWASAQRFVGAALSRLVRRATDLVRR